MTRFRLADGTYKNVKPEHLDIFKERYPSAIQIPSLEQQKIEVGKELEADDEIGFFEGISRSFENVPIELKNYWNEFQLGVAPYIEFMGGPGAARALLGDFSKESMGRTGLLDPENGQVVIFNNEAYDRDGHDAEENKRYYELIKLRQSVPRYQENPVEIIDIASGKNIKNKIAEEAQEKFKQTLDNQKKLKKITDSKGFIDAVKSGEIGDAIVQSGDFLKQTTMQLILARITAGTSMMGIMYGNAYTTFNDEKSKRLYGEDDPDRFKKLIENDEDQIAIPAALGGLGYLMERAGYKGMMKEMAKKGMGPTSGVALLVTGNKEGLTEYGQGLTERLNLNLGKGMSLEDGVKDVSRYMFTEQAWENYFAGLIGGTGVAGGGKVVNAALRADETSNQFINSKIKNIENLLELKAKTTNSKKIKNYEDLIQIQEAELKEYLKNNNEISKYLSKKQEDGLVNLLNQKRDARKEIKDINSLYKKGLLSDAEFEASKSEIDNRINRYDNGILRIKNDANMSLLMQDLDAAGDLIKNIKNLEQLVYKTPAEFLAAVKAEYLAQGKTEKEFKQATEGVSIDGLKIGNKLLINATVAAEKNAFATGTHELLHGVLKYTLQANDGSGNLSLKGESIVKDFINTLSSKEKRLIEQKLKDGNYKINEDGTDKEFKEYGEEYLNFYAQLSKQGEFSLNAIQKVGKWLSSFYRTNSEFKNINFESGEQTRAFLDAFVADSKDGIYRKEFAELAEEGVEMKGTTEFSKEASDNVQRIYEEKGVGGALDIIEQFKPITNKIVERRREAPGFDRQLLTDEIETGKRGILDLIQEYDPESGVPLAAYINKFLPSRAIEASKRVLGEEFTEDVAERVDIATEEVVTETKAKPKPRKIILSDRLGVTDKVSKAISKIVPNLDIDKLTFKTLKNKIPNITGELFGIAPKKIENLANLTKKELQSAQMFINKNADLLINMLPEGATASGTATGVPNTLLKAFYTKADRAKMAKTGSKAGLAVQQKNNIKKTDFLETFGIIDGKPDRTDRNTSARVLALANLTGKMITNQAVRQKVGEADAKSKETISRLKDGKSNVMFSKSTEITKADKVKAIMKNVTNKKFKHGDISKEIGSKIIAETVISRPSGKTGILKPAKVRDLFGKYNDLETGAQARDRVANSFIEQYPQYFDVLRTTMGGGITISMFQTTAEFELAVPNPVSKQNVVKRFHYHKDKKLNPNAIAKIKNEDFIKNEKAKLPLFKQFLLDVETYLKDNPQDVWFFEEMTKDTQNNMNSIVRIVAPFVAYPVKDGKPVYNKIGIEEHSFPQIVMGRSGISAAVAGEVESLWPVIQASYMQMSLLEVDDNKVTASGMKSSVPDVFYEKILPRIISGELKNLPDGYVAFVRYAYAGVDLNNYKLLNEQTVTEFFGVNGIMDPETGLPDIKKQNDILIKQLTGEVAPRYGENIAKVKFSKNVENHNRLNKAINNSRILPEPRGITVLDFDDTLATTESLVKYTTPEGKTGSLNAEQYASTYEDLLDKGYTFDFSDFNKVVKGKLAPLFNKAIKLQGKFGPKNMFVLTARPPAAQKPIFDFLKANGLNIPLENITGLGNSTAEAKALWIADKVTDGYNDFYFADDALQNVQAVKNMLDQFDVKSKVQQAKVKFSKNMNNDFNKILEEVTGIDAIKRFSDIKARKRGASKGKFRFFIPPSHEDFVGLLYNFMGKGRRGDQHRNFFEQALVRPLNRAYREIDTAKQAIANDYKELNKQFEDVKKKLTKKTPDGDFTFEDAIRVYLWDKHGYDIPGLSPTDQNNLSELIMNDAELQAYAETLNVISKQDKYVDPGNGWEGGNIKTDLIDATGRVGRTKYFAEFNENADILFSEENLNKIEAGYGKDFRSALEDMLYRIKTGVNRPKGQTGTINKFMNYLNGSVGTVMFFNVRSAILQQMSIVNYINFADNNIFAAGKAFANQPQYWKDFAFIFNSDMLKQRRGGIGTDINGADLAQAVQGSKDPTKVVISKLLKLGFLPTQIGDNIAIATGGATFYRNRINKYIKDGLSKKEAETRAFTDFQDLTQSTQQSSRPDMTSKQQASWIGKLVLNFQNITSQYNRIIKKAALDIVKGRISPPYTNKTQSNLGNLSKILYYGGIQNVIFYSLQTALFAVMFDDDEDEDQILKKKERVINGSIDSILRGSGIYGAVISTLKNTLIKFKEQREKGYNKDESAVLMELLNFSPVVGIKARQIVNAEKTINYNENVMSEMQTFEADNPQWSAVTNYTQALTNFPANRLYQKSINMRNALDKDYTNFQRVMFFSGYTTWSLGLGDNERIIEAKEKAKINKKNKKKSSLKRKTNLKIKKFK